jgi:pimeloyl-ACP methyl ester carboxylesterase
MRSLVLALVLFVASAAASAAEFGAIVMHGKWGSPDQNVDAIASALTKSGYLVVSPEMPWSRRRNYDKSAEEADAEIDAQVEKLRAGGAKRIVLVGHSMGAAYALHYAGRTQVDAVVAIAPGHRPESPRIAQALANDVSRARDLVAAGKGAETLSFSDFNSGARRSRLTASASSFVSYFDPAGPMNMARNAGSMKPTPVLWLVPTREESPLREGNIALFKRLPANPANQLAEPASDHLNAPQASVALAIEWLRGLEKMALK